MRCGGDLILGQGVEIRSGAAQRAPGQGHIQAISKDSSANNRPSFVPSPAEYRHLYGLTPERLKRANPDALVMHPGPMNRGVEIDSIVADLPERSLITTQGEMGVAMRMACLDVLTRSPRGVEGWQ